MKEVYGVFGIIDLPDGPHLVIIEEATFMGQLLKVNVFKVEKLMYIPIRMNQTM